METRVRAVRLLPAGRIWLLGLKGSWSPNPGKYPLPGGGAAWQLPCTLKGQQVVLTGRPCPTLPTSWGDAFQT